MKKPQALDLYCGGGGATIGLQQAGFEVTGIDIKPRPKYPRDHFIQADVLNMPVNFKKYDFIWASPPCQRHSIATLTRGFDPTVHPCHIIDLRKMLKGIPFYTIENVPRAPLRTNLILTGPSVGLKKIWRRRHFENSFFIWQPPIGEHGNIEKIITVTTSMCSNNHFYRRKEASLPGRPPRWVCLSVMGFPRWTWRDYPLTAQKKKWSLLTYREIGEAVPPPYARYIGEHVIKLL